MSAHFSADWLALREPADQRARSERLVRLLNHALPPGRAIAILDLASGTGSNARHLASRLAPGHGGRVGQVGQRWLLVDHDSALLDRARALTPFEVSTRVADLSGLEAHADWLEGHDVITASALLDLVSHTWLGTLLTCCHARRAHVLFPLNYDGRIVCAPSEPEDDWVRDLVNQHQRTDKGFGLALGPDAARAAAEFLATLGYTVECESSDWLLGADDAELQRQLIDGWADAASEIASHDGGRIEDWRGRRQRHVSSRDSRITVGHQDVLGLAPSAGANEHNE